MRKLASQKDESWQFTSPETWEKLKLLAPDSDLSRCGPEVTLNLCMSWNLLRPCPGTVSPWDSPSHTSQILALCNFRCVCQGHLSCIPTASLCVEQHGCTHSSVLKDLGAPKTQQVFLQGRKEVMHLWHLLENVYNLLIVRVYLKKRWGNKIGQNVFYKNMYIDKYIFIYKYVLYIIYVIFSLYLNIPTW